MRTHAHAHSASRSPQDGSVVIILAIAIGMLIALLGSIQIGYTAYQKRELDKAADMAALSGVQSLNKSNGSTDCSAATSNAVAILKANGVTDAKNNDIQCGYWVVPNGEPADEINRKSFFNPTTPSGSKENAVQVKLDRALQQIIPLSSSNKKIQSVSTAKTTEPLAVFSVGSRLIELGSNGLIGQILYAIGLDTKTINVLDYKGLLTAKITPQGLLKYLVPLNSDLDITAGTVDGLLDLKPVKVGSLLTATASLLYDQKVIDLDAKAALETIALKLDVSELTVKLFGNSDINLDQDKLLYLSTSDAQAALQSSINVADIIATSVLLANKDNFLDLKLSIGTKIDPDDNPVQIKIIEPPVIAMGGVGAMATNAQIQLRLNVTTKDIPIIGPLISILAEIRLPVVVNIGKSTGTLEDLCSDNLNENQAKIGVTASLADICITEGDCSPPAKPSPTSIIKVPLLLGLLDVKSSASTCLLCSGESISDIFNVDVPKTITTGIKANTSDIVSSLISGLEVNVLKVPLLSDLLKLIASLSSILLQPVDQLLNIVLEPVLSALGINLGVTDINLRGVQCGTPMLVETQNSN